MKPILFNSEMVRAILDGRKTVTRRVIKPQPTKDADLMFCYAGSHNRDIGKWHDKQTHAKWVPPYHTGDIFYVRETWRMQNYGYNPGEKTYDGQELQYRADFSDDENACYGRRGGCAPCKWHPSIHMPREAARIFLRVTNVRVERLQEVTEEQAVSEGCKAGNSQISGGPWGIEDDPDEWDAREDFRQTWDSTIKPVDLPSYGWSANPWVWVIEFERCEKPEEGSIKC